MLSAPLLLASNSPRRKEMLSWLGWTFRVQAQDVDESPLPGEHPSRYVCRLAYEKAVSARKSARPGEWVVAADTIVADGPELLGKPQDQGDARRMLEQLRGRVHQVYTALAILPVGESQPVQDLCCEDVAMRNYSGDEMDAYIASGDPLDKAGAYAIQHAGFRPVDSLDGCFACIMGMPLCHLARSLKKAGMPFQQDVSGICQQNLDYTCPVHAQVLGWQGRYKQAESITGSKE
jgi:septum formation protein